MFEKKRKRNQIQLDRLAHHGLEPTIFVGVKQTEYWKSIDSKADKVNGITL